MHKRLSVHQICFQQLDIAGYVEQCRKLNATQLGFISPALLAPNGEAEASRALADSGIALQSVTHVFRTGHLTRDKQQLQRDRDSLLRLIDIAASLQAKSIYMLTGGHGGFTWDDAADVFCEGLAPCIEHARASGVALAIENASCLYADLHIAHSLADTLKLAEMADIGVCIELFFCWAEADLETLFKRAMPRCVLVQSSDYVYGDRALPARAVPGDGTIPLASILALLDAAGYRGAIDIELLGPRIEEEGAFAAVQRAAQHLGNILAQRDATQ